MMHALVPWWDASRLQVTAANMQPNDHAAFALEKRVGHYASQRAARGLSLTLVD